MVSNVLELQGTHIQFETEKRSKLLQFSYLFIYLLFGGKSIEKYLKRVDRQQMQQSLHYYVKELHHRKVLDWAVDLL